MEGQISKRPNFFCGNAYYPWEIYLIFVASERFSVFTFYFSFPGLSYSSYVVTEKTFLPFSTFELDPPFLQQLSPSPSPEYDLPVHCALKLDARFVFKQILSFFSCIFFILFHLRCNSTVPGYRFYGLLSEGIDKLLNG